MALPSPAKKLRRPVRRATCRAYRSKKASRRFTVCRPAPSQLRVDARAPGQVVLQRRDGEFFYAELERELMAYCEQSISKIKCPRSIDFEAELPRHPTGKLYKRLLQDRYWGKGNSRIV
jgi:acyl-CoA synthetase (AMP-forming)/AMP-acid ligase II